MGRGLPQPQTEGDQPLGSLLGPRMRRQSKRNPTWATSWPCDLGQGDAPPLSLSFPVRIRRKWNCCLLGVTTAIHEKDARGLGPPGTPRGLQRAGRRAPTERGLREALSARPVRGRRDPAAPDRRPRPPLRARARVAGRSAPPSGRRPASRPALPRARSDLGGRAGRARNDRRDPARGRGTRTHHPRGTRSPPPPPLTGADLDASVRARRAVAPVAAAGPAQKGLRLRHGVSARRRDPRTRSGGERRAPPRRRSVPAPGVREK